MACFYASAQFIYYFNEVLPNNSKFYQIGNTSSPYYNCSSVTCRYVWWFQDNICRKPAIFPSIISVQPMECHRSTVAAAPWSLLALTQKDLQFDFNFEQNGKCFSTLNHQSRDHVVRKPRFSPTGLSWGRLAWPPCSRLLRRTSAATTSPPLPLTSKQDSRESQLTCCTLPTSAPSFSASFLVKFTRSCS